MSTINLYNTDCMEFMRGLPDKAYDLAIVDPMYDISDSALVPGSAISTNGVKRNHVKQAKTLAKQDVELRQSRG